MCERYGVSRWCSLRPMRAAGRLSGLLLAVLAMCSSIVFATEAHAQTWTLSKAQRQNYLQYYAPLIMHRADEDNGKIGRDWMSNFDFDRDANFSTNRYNWLQTPQYIAAGGNPASPYANWRIRPTVYTALIEYMEGGSKSVSLLYHIYYASDKAGTAIHDWERVEIHIRNVAGTPGTFGEYVNATIITDHKEHIIRQSTDINQDMNFMQTATGKHLMVWQADENGGAPGKRERELHYVQNPYSWIAGRFAYGSNRAEVDITDDGDKANVHYVFVPETSSSAVSAWNAKPLAFATASSQYSGRDNATNAPWYAVPRITYELQDLADLHLSSWQFSNWQTHWTSDNVRDVLLESPIVNEAGATEVPAGLQRFYLGSRDLYQYEGREGFLWKKWMWGDYSAERDPDAFSNTDEFGGYAGTGLDSLGWNRSAVSGYYYSPNNYWWQHDYFVHTGGVNTQASREVGFWLAGQWYRPEYGGFDGRWVALFDDRPNDNPVAPLSLSASLPGDLCTSEAWVTAYAVGGQPPYNFSWANASPYSAASDAPNYAYVLGDTYATVTVTSADGQTRTQGVWFTPYCDWGGGYQ